MRRMIRAAVVTLTLGICCATLGPPAANAAGWPVTKQGEHNENVHTAQLLLMQHGINVGVDAKFGSATKNSVMAFQRSKGLPADGVIGGQTWSRLVVQVRMGANAPHAVNALKVQLHKHGVRPQDLNGVFDQKTHDVVRWIQGSHGLAADGIVGTNTWSFLLNPGGGGGGGGGYRLPLDRHAAERWRYGRSHHDYPAIDIGVPPGTKVYAVHGGNATPTTSKSCGYGIRVVAGDGGTYSYCHFRQPAVASGRIPAGQLIGYSGSTGNSFSPHLHLQIRRPGDGARVCPQPLLLAVYDGHRPPPIHTLPTRGCTH